MASMFCHTLLVIAVILGNALCAHARVVRIVIEQRESPAFRGQSFGKA